MIVASFWILASILLGVHALEATQDETAQVLRGASDSNFIQMLQHMMNQAAPFIPQVGRANQIPFMGQQIPGGGQMLPNQIIAPQQQQFMRQGQPMFANPQPQPMFTNQFQQFQAMPQQQMMLPQQPQAQQTQAPQASPVSSQASAPPVASNDISVESEAALFGQPLFSNDKCGQVRPMVTKFVAGGAPMDNHEHPWYVQIIIHNSEFTESETYCGGTLINEQWVLTAAHCYDDMRRDRLAKSTHIIFRGLHGIRRKFTAKADFVVVHPNYVPAMLPWEAEAQGLKPGPFNDLALVRLRIYDMPHAIRIRLVPVCMPAPHTVVAEGTVCKVMGHGFMSAEDEKRFRMPSELQAANVRISSNRACQDDVESRTIKEKINEKTTCVRGRIHPCVGDSGGPLVCTGSTRRHIDGSENDNANLNDERVMSDDFQPRKWYLVGVTSFAVSTDEHDHCGTFKSAVFGLVSAQLDWIRTTILKNSNSHYHNHHHHHNNNNFFKKM